MPASLSMRPYLFMLLGGCLGVCLSVSDNKFLQNTGENASKVKTPGHTSVSRDSKGSDAFRAA